MFRRAFTTGLLRYCAYRGDFTRANSYLERARRLLREERQALGFVQARHDDRDLGRLRLTDDRLEAPLQLLCNSHPSAQL